MLNEMQKKPKEEWEGVKILEIFQRTNREPNRKQKSCLETLVRKRRILFVNKLHIVFTYIRRVIQFW